MALQILFRECRLSQKNAWESEKNALGKIMQVITLVNGKNVLTKVRMFLVIYGIAETIHRMRGRNYVLPLSSSNIRIYQ